MYLYSDDLNLHLLVQSKSLIVIQDIHVKQDTCYNNKYEHM